ncbi:glycoside hydrolase family 3 C-terminal domain-containing protein, partial [Mycobacterium tuberculosis]|nr:glycoside hydrolase family 3 C-terminal domain-containing protein [Mycobacterium tuberculosis]
ISATGGKGVIAPNGKVDSKPDVAIIVLGEKPYAEFEGDIPHLAFTPQAEEVELIKPLKAKKVPVVGLFLSGRPLFAG